LFILLNNGQHPLFCKGDTRKVFTEKLANPQWNFNKNVSEMGKFLFLKLCELNPLHRYNATEALKHPFITRRKFDKIPMTFMESWKKRELKHKFKEFIGGMIFILNQNKTSINLKFKIDLKYLEKAERFSNEFKEKFLKIRENCLEGAKINLNEELISIKPEIDSPLKSSKKSSISTVSNLATGEDSTSISPLKKNLKPLFFFQKIESINPKKENTSLTPIKLGNQRLNVECNKISLKKENNISKNLSQFKIQLSNMDCNSNHKNRLSFDQEKDKINLNLENCSVSKYKLNNLSNNKNSFHNKNFSLGNVILPLIMASNQFNPTKEEKLNFKRIPLKKGSLDFKRK